MSRFILTLVAGLLMGGCASVAVNLPKDVADEDLLVCHYLDGKEINCWHFQDFMRELEKRHPREPASSGHEI